jgi:putative transposase
VTAGRFDPQLIAKYQRRFPGFDDKIISMYARGMSTREIVGHLRDLYGIEVSPVYPVPRRRDDDPSQR